MVETDTVRSLLETIELRLGRLRERADIELDSYRADRDEQDIVERNFELAIQACIDLGLHVLADLPHRAPATNRGVFTALADEDVLSRQLAQRLQSMAGFRNVLAHGYATVDPERVHENLGRLGDIREYVQEMADFLRELGAWPER